MKNLSFNKISGPTFNLIKTLFIISNVNKNFETKFDMSLISDNLKNVSLEVKNLFKKLKQMIST